VLKPILLINLFKAFLYTYSIGWLDEENILNLEFALFLLKL